MNGRRKGSATQTIVLILHGKNGCICNIQSKDTSRHSEEASYIDRVPCFVGPSSDQTLRLLTGMDLGCAQGGYYRLGEVMDVAGRLCTISQIND